jgi:hypothetical protein
MRCPFRAGQATAGSLAGKRHGVFTQSVKDADIPQDHGVVAAAGGQGVPVTGERHRGHEFGVAGQGVAEAAGPGRVAMPCRSA